MNRHFVTLSLFATLLLACVSFATAAFAQDDGATKPPAMYLAIPPHSYYPVEPSTSQLTQWTPCDRGQWSTISHSDRKPAPRGEGFFVHADNYFPTQFPPSQT
jgi:hypothetical protein